MDNLVPDFHLTIYLSNGDIIFEDSEKGLDSTWVRVGKFLEEEPNLYITRFGLHGPGGVIRDIVVSSDMEYLWFSMKITRFFGGADKQESFKKSVGYSLGDLLHLEWWDRSGKMRKEQRNIGACNLQWKSFIKNKIYEPKI